MVVVVEKDIRRLEVLQNDALLVQLYNGLAYFPAVATYFVDRKASVGLPADKSSHALFVQLHYYAHFPFFDRCAVNLTNIVTSRGGHEKNASFPPEHVVFFFGKCRRVLFDCDPVNPARLFQFSNPYLSNSALVIQKILQFQVCCIQFEKFVG